MVVRILRIGSIVLSLLVVAGWGWFAVDETQAASQQAQSEILTNTSLVDPAPGQERVREEHHNPLHERIDDINDVLLRPFLGVVATSGSDWTKRSVPALLALLTYGLGLATLARYFQLR